MKTHGMSSTATYRKWKAMKARCSYDYTGAAYSEVSYCKSWESFEQFYQDMGECPKGLTLERKDNRKGYSKDNCVWASADVQNRNRNIKRKAGFRNVKLMPAGNYQVRLMHQGKRISLGVFYTELDAVKAYNRFAVQNNYPLAGGV